MKRKGISPEKDEKGHTHLCLSAVFTRRDNGLGGDEKEEGGESKETKPKTRWRPGGGEGANSDGTKSKLRGESFGKYKGSEEKGMDVKNRDQ